MGQGVNKGRKEKECLRLSGSLDGQLNFIGSYMYHQLELTKCILEAEHNSASSVSLHLFWFPLWKDFLENHLQLKCLFPRGHGLVTMGNQAAHCS